MIRTNVVKITDSRLATVRRGHRLITSLEGENPGGSVKDHMVEAELRKLLANGELSPGEIVSEISSGSTALSLAYYSRAFDLQCELFVPHTLEGKKRAQLEALGAKLHFVDPKEGYALYADYLKATGTHSFNQFGNRDLANHYASLSQQVKESVDLVVGTVGTGHSLVGVTDGFRKNLIPTSAEPSYPAAVPGIRNVRLEHFGENDPCETSRLKRFEVEKEAYFPDSIIETDQGLVSICESFRVVLGAIDQMSLSSSETVFALGAANKKAG